MLLGSRNGLIAEANKEELMYKQALQNWLDLFAGRLTTFVDDTMEDLSFPLFYQTATPIKYRVDFTLTALKTISSRNSFFTSCAKTISCPNLITIIGAQHFQGSSSLESVSFPNLETIDNFSWYFFNCTALKTVNLGKVQSLPSAVNNSFAYDTSLTDVFVESMQSDTLLSYTQMLSSATTGSFTPHQVVFHCADGDVVWSDDDNAWVIASDRKSVV